MTDLVVVSLEDWDDVWRRNQYLVQGLLDRQPDLRVLFVEPAADPLHDAAAGRRPAFGHCLRAIGDTGRLFSFRPTKLLPRRWDRSADRRLIHSVAARAGALGMDRPVLWINDPGMAMMMTATGWPTLYDITDDWTSADRTEQEHARVSRGDALLLESAGEVVACSPELVWRASMRRPATARGVELIRNAVDVAAYRDPRPRPEDLPRVPVALYAGTLHSDRFDVALTARTAMALQGKATVVLVGPNLLDADATRQLTEAGAILAGPRTPRELIGYLQHAGVLIVPHRVTAFTDSLDPIKLYEYQAVGRPVVSTPVAGFRDADDPRIALATPETFPAAVRTALSSGSDATAAPATVPDWGERVDAMARVIARLRAG